MPAIEDPGQIKLLPGLPYDEFLFEALDKFKHIKLAPNPLRLSFLGKEIVVCRYNYLKKMKQNHNSKINFA